LPVEDHSAIFECAWQSGLLSFGGSFALLAGMGLRMGQIVGETDARAERCRQVLHTPD
jgi:hypothetical protein